MKRSDFLKSLTGLIGIASNPEILTTISKPLAKSVAKKCTQGATLGVINKCYVSAIDPILDTRMVNKMIDKYGQDDYSLKELFKDKS